MPTARSLGEVKNYLDTHHKWEVTNADGAAQMLLWPLNAGAKKLDDIPAFKELKSKSPDSFKKAETIFAKMKKYFWDIVRIEAQEARSRADLEKKKVAMMTQENVRSLRDSIVYRGPLTTYLLENFSGQMQGTETWSKLFFDAYAQGKTDISKDQMVAHLGTYQRDNMNKIYQKAYEFLLGQDMANKLVRTYDYHKVKKIGACLAKLCSQGVEHIEPAHLQIPLAGSTTLSSLGIQDDIVKFKGEGLYEHASLVHLNEVYRDFITTNKSAQVVLEEAKIHKDAQLAKSAKEYGVSRETLASNDRGFSPKKRTSKQKETFAEFEARQAKVQKEREDYLRKKYG